MTQKRTAYVGIWQSMFLLASLLLTIGCNDQPTDLGKEFSSDTLNTYLITTEDTTLITDVVADWQPAFLGSSIPGGLYNRGFTYIGNHGGINARSHMRFGVPLNDTLMSANQIDIQEATLRIYLRRYYWGDPSKGWEFTVHPVLQSWNRASTTIDTLAEMASQAPLYGEAIAEVSGAIEWSTSAYVAVDIPLNSTDFLKDWFVLGATTATYEQIHGLALLSPEGKGDAIMKLSASVPGDEDVPTSEIIVTYTIDGMAQATTETLTAIQDGTYLTRPNAEVQEQLDGSLFAQGGVIGRGRLMFDVSMIPPLSSINKAELILTRNGNLSDFGYFIGDSTGSDIGLNVPYGVATRTFLFDGVDTTGLTSGLFIDLLEQIDDSDKFSADRLNALVELWVRGEENNGIILRVENEVSQLNRWVFYGNDAADASLRPVLRIHYTTRPR